MSDAKRNEAISFAQHYFEIIARKAGVNWSEDNVAEIRAMVNATIDAAIYESVDRAVARMLEHRANEKLAENRSDAVREPLVADEDVPICPYCSRQAELVRSTYLYGPKHDYGWMWICEDCDAYVGCHRNTAQPLGTLANADLRAARKKAHAAFDPIWKFGLRDRREAYAWLADELGIEVDACHIGMADEAMCQRVVEICQQEMRNA